MERALSAAASGMEAQEFKMSVIANNLANVPTAAFKRSRAEFQDVLYDNLRPAGITGADGTQVPAGTQVGQGVRIAGTVRDYAMGDLKRTNMPYDVAISGNGFFQVTQPNGGILYTRDGSFKVDATGRLVTLEGQPLYPQIVIPQNTTQMNIASDGTVSVMQNGSSNQATQIGQITLAQFINPAGLEPLGHNLAGATPASGEPLVYQPGTQGLGTLEQGVLEMSNVKPVDEMIELISTQRAYEMGTRIIQAADQMLASTTQLR